MSPATAKVALLVTMDRAWERLERALDTVPPETALASGTQGDVPRDLVLQVAFGLSMFLDAHADAMAGRPVRLPASGTEWMRFAADRMASGCGATALGWDEARTLLRDYHDQVLAFLQVRTGDDLFGAAMTGGAGSRSVGDWARIAGADTFDAAAERIAGMLPARPVDALAGPVVGGAGTG